VRIRSREMLLPVLLFPVLIPLVLACLRGTTLLLNAAGGGELQTWLSILAAYDLMVLAAGWLIFDAVIED